MEEGNATRGLDPTERAKLNLGLRGQGAANIISESGLYLLVLKSRKPEAKAFQKWVTAEVLPSIRKTGEYVAPTRGYTSRPRLGTSDGPFDVHKGPGHSASAVGANCIQQPNVRGQKSVPCIRLS